MTKRLTRLTLEQVGQLYYCFGRDKTKLPFTRATAVWNESYDSGQICKKLFDDFERIYNDLNPLSIYALGLSLLVSERVSDKSLKEYTSEEEEAIIKLPFLFFVPSVTSPGRVGGARGYAKSFMYSFE